MKHRLVTTMDGPVAATYFVPVEEEQQPVDVELAPLLTDTQHKPRKRRKPLKRLQAPPPDMLLGGTRVLKRKRRRITPKRIALTAFRGLWRMLFKVNTFTYRQALLIMSGYALGLIILILSHLLPPLWRGGGPAPFTFMDRLAFYFLIIGMMPSVLTAAIMVKSKQFN